MAALPSRQSSTLPSGRISHRPASKPKAGFGRLRKSDTDYDGRTFCICQAFFPDKSKWIKLARALCGKGVVDERAFDKLSGLTNLPFPRSSRLEKERRGESP